ADVPVGRPEHHSSAGVITSRGLPYKRDLMHRAEYRVRQRCRRGIDDSGLPGEAVLNAQLEVLAVPVAERVRYRDEGNLTARGDCGGAALVQPGRPACWEPPDAADGDLAEVVGIESVGRYDDARCGRTG